MPKLILPLIVCISCVLLVLIPCVTTRLQIIPCETTTAPEPVRVIPSTNNTNSAETNAPPLEPTKPTARRTYIRGPRGGCYYVSDSGRKVYVDHSMCN
jgi:hypothetical protein